MSKYAPILPPVNIFFMGDRKLEIGIRKETRERRSEGKKSRRLEIGIRKEERGKGSGVRDQESGKGKKVRR